MSFLDFLHTKRKFPYILNKINNYYVILPSKSYEHIKSYKLQKTELQDNVIYNGIFNNETMEIELVDELNKFKYNKNYNCYYFLLNQPSNMFKLLVFDNDFNIISNNIIQQSDYFNEILNNWEESLRNKRIIV